MYKIGCDMSHDQTPNKTSVRPGKIQIGLVAVYIYSVILLLHAAHLIVEHRCILLIFGYKPSVFDLSSWRVNNNDVGRQ